MEKIVVLDFGSQTTHLIARRLREGGVLAEVVPGDEPFENWVGESVKGVILSGSPASVHQHDAPRVDQSLLSSSLPVLGICYGLQRLTHDSGGSVATREKREYGRAAVALRKTSPLTE
ncbi:MAG: glutamine amidotransferase-related protein, partial [Spirochaetaceae bacterium]